MSSYVLRAPFTLCRRNLKTEVSLRIIKKNQMFSLLIIATPERFENGTITGHFYLCTRKTRVGKYHDYRNTDHRFRKYRFFGLKSVFGKLRFHDRLVWTVVRSRRANKPTVLNSPGVKCTALLQQTP